MIGGTYQVEIDTPMGRKTGTVRLLSDGDKAIGDIDVPPIGKKRIEGTMEGENAFTAKGTFKMLLIGKVEYSLRGEVDGDVVRISIDSNKGVLDIEGNRL